MVFLFSNKGDKYIWFFEIKGKSLLSQFYDIIFLFQHWHHYVLIIDLIEGFLLHFSLPHYIWLSTWWVNWAPSQNYLLKKPPLFPFSNYNKFIVFLGWLWWMVEVNWIQFRIGLACFKPFFFLHLCLWRILFHFFKMKSIFCSPFIETHWYDSLRPIVHSLYVSL